MQNHILPNPEFIRKSRAAILGQLHVSMNHIVFDVLSEQFEPSVSMQDMNDLILGGSRFPSSTVFAVHAALLNAVLADSKAEIPKLLGILKHLTLRNSEEPEYISTTGLSEDSMHVDDIFVLQRAFADDVGLTTVLAKPPVNEMAQSIRLIHEALTVLDQTAQSWKEELLLLANQFYFATAGSGNDLVFGGAAVFDAFGAILLNPLGLRDVSTVLMTLVHESSHQQMFLYHLTDPIVLNDEDAAFSSPLRLQPRPMEGIFHAMWVSARMVVAADAVLKSPSRPDWADTLIAHQERARSAFHDCVGTVSEHADLSILGKTLFKDAREAVDAI